MNDQNDQNDIEVKRDIVFSVGEKVGNRAGVMVGEALPSDETSNARAHKRDRT